jgi:hypothetical protein
MTGPGVPGPAALRQPKLGRRYTREDIQHADAAKLERCAVIRRDFDAGMPERRSSAGATSAAFKGLHGRIDVMIEADPAIATAAI